MKQGFVIIEILLAATIATMIGGMLFLSLYQITQVATVVENYADVFTRASILRRQLEKDITGTFIPVAAEKMEEKKTQDTKQAGPQAGLPEKLSGQQAAQGGKKKEPVPVVTHVFYGTQKDDQLDVLTFITNNPMQIYWAPKAGKAKPRIARVVYRLVKDKNAPVYTLMRQEGYDVYFQTYKEGTQAPRQYPMIEGIKRMTILYGIKEKNDTQNAKDQKDQPQKITYKTVKEWKKNDEQSKNGKNDKKNELELPAFILIKVALWDQQKKRDVSFEFKVSLIAQGKAAPAPVQVQETSKPPAQQPVQGAPKQGAQGVPPRPAMGPVLPIIPGLATNLDTGQIEIMDLVLDRSSTFSGALYAL
jgi:hypothetical protein